MRNGVRFGNGDGKAAVEYGRYFVRQFLPEVFE